MLSTWVLLIFLASTQGGGLTSIEFHSQTECQEAIDQIENEWDRFGRTVLTACIKRSAAEK